LRRPVFASEGYGKSRGLVLHNGSLFLHIMQQYIKTVPEQSFDRDPNIPEAIIREMQ
jgi:hypothetical protein